MTGLQVISDAPAAIARDALNFTRYVGPLVDILTDPATETPFTIGIFGPWGSGKSTLLAMLDERLAGDCPREFVRVHFNPWVHRAESNMLVPLLHTLNDTLMDDQARFDQAVSKIGRVLLALGSDIVLRKLTADVLSLQKINDVKKTFQEEKGQVESEMRRLKSTLQGVADDVFSRGARIVLFVDDLDRCQPDQIIDLLEAIKLFLDLRHTFIVLAVDKEVIDHGIQVKYAKFDLGDRSSTVGAQYLEKMIQLPLSLYPLGQGQVGDFIKALNVASPVLDSQLPLLVSLAQPNPRKIKSILNIYNVTQAIVAGTPGLAGLKPDLVARLTVLRVQSGELYGDVLAMPRLLEALEKVYQGQLDPKDNLAFQPYGRLRDVIHQACVKYYAPDSYLAVLFKDSTFAAEAQDLARYLTMLGA